MSSIDARLKELMEQVCDPLSEFNHIKRMYGSVFVEVDHVPGADSRVRIMEPQEITVTGRIADSREYGGTYQTSRNEPEEKRVVPRRRHLLAIMDDLSKLEARIVSEFHELSRVDGDNWQFRHVVSPAMPVPEWPELRWWQGTELTWECRGQALLEQRERALLRRHHEARARQVYERRSAVIRTQKRARSPRKAGFQS